MRASLEVVHRQLMAALQLSDRVYSELRLDDRGIDSQQRMLRVVGDISAVLGEIAQLRPDLLPEPEVAPSEVGRAYGELLVEVHDLCRDHEIERAIERAEAFLLRVDLPELLRTQAEQMKEGLHEHRRLKAHPRPSSVCGVVLFTEDPLRLARFYTEVLGVAFEREEHGGLAAHYGADVGETHFGLHPPTNFAQSVGATRSAVAFAVEALEPYLERLERLGAPVVLPPHDEGFGRTTTYADPEGHLLELVELDYAFDDSDER